MKKDVITTVIAIVLFCGVVSYVVNKVGESIEYKHNEEKILLQNNENKQDNSINSNKKHIILELNKFIYVDMKVEGNVVKTLTNDGQMIMVFDEPQNISDIMIDIEEMNVDNVNTQVFYDETDEITGNFYVEKVLNEGINIIEIEHSEKIKVLRIDISDSQDVIVNINQITINN